MADPRVVGLLAALAVAGCATEPTRIVVVTDTDLEVPGRVDAVRFVIDARAVGGDVDSRLVVLGTGGAALPLVLPIVHDGGALGPIVIAVQGLRGEAPIVERAAELSFVAGRSVALALPLEAACEGRAGAACGQGETCAAGTCVPRALDSSALPEWRSRDALPSDAGPDDAGGGA